MTDIQLGILGTLAAGILLLLVSFGGFGAGRASVAQDCRLGVFQHASKIYDCKERT